MTSLRIGDPVQVKDETEQLTLVCLDNGRAWVRDGAGNHLDYPEEDLVRARSKSWRETVDEFFFNRDVMRAVAKRRADDLVREEAWREYDSDRSLPL